MNIAVRTNETPADRPGDSPEQIELPGFKVTGCELDRPAPAAVPAPPPEDDPGEFDWRRDATIVIEHQASIAVYRNPRNAVVIREERQFGPDEDHFVILSSPEAVRAVIAALQRELRDWR